MSILNFRTSKLNVHRTGLDSFITIPQVAAPTVTGQLVALVISSPRTAGQLVAKTRRQNEKLTSADHTKYQI